MATKSQFVESRISPALVEEVQNLIDGEGGALTRFNKAMRLLESQNIPYKVRLFCWEVLVHKDNRGGLGLNPFDVHKNIKTVKQIGADRDELRKATAFELAQTGPSRKEQLDFNQRLIDRSNELLAPITGKERVCSVGCSHFTAGCRAANHGCVTPEESLQDGHGNRINKQTLCASDKVYESLIDGGWEWTVLPLCCQQIWPKLPDLAQDALNATHSTYTMASELQVMVSMASRHAAGGDWKRITDDIKASQPPCSEYLEVIAQFVQNFAGGQGAPIVRFLEGFAKEFGGSKKLGEEFIQAIVSAKFPTEASTFPFVRAGLMATNLIGKKIKNGFATLITKNDIGQWTKRHDLMNVKASETTLSSSWGKLSDLSTRQTLSVSQCNELFGRLATRMVLFMLKKQKEGPYATEFKSLTSISDKFNAELTAALGGTAEPAAESQTEDGDKGDTSDTSKLATVSDASGPVWIAKQKGFEVGNRYFDKSEAGYGDVYELIQFSDVGAQLVECTLAPRPPIEKTVAFEDLNIKSWGLFKGKLQTKVDADITPYTVGTHPGLAKTVLKADLFSALMELGSEHVGCEKLAVDFFFNPFEVRAKTQVAKGALKLVPITDISKIVSKSGSSTTVVSGPEQFVLEAPLRPKDADTKGWKDSVFSAYWWVRETSEELTECNLKLTKVKSGQWTFPVMENTKAIKAFDRFILHQPSGPAAKKPRA